MAARISPNIIKRMKLLRSHGWSLPEISIEVKISKTSVLRNIKEVKILPEYQSAWSIKRGGSKKRMLIKQELALEEAKKLVYHMSDKEKLLYISALYWAEGNKKDFILTNTDPILIKTFVNGLRQVLGVKDEEIKASLRIYEDMDQEKCLNFWSGIVKIPEQRFLTTNILKGKKAGKLEYGMCRLRIAKGGDHLKKIMSINKVASDCF